MQTDLVASLFTATQRELLNRIRIQTRPNATSIFPTNQTSRTGMIGKDPGMKAPKTIIPEN
jgi:hypothetical protein